MNAKRGKSRSWMSGGLLAGAALVLLLLAFQLGLSYEDKVSAAEISTRNLAAIFEARLEATLRRTDADLHALSNEIPLAALSQKAVPRYAQQVNASLDGRLFNIDEMAGFRVYDANGDALYSSGSDHVLRVNVSDRAYFRQLRADPAAGLLFSEVVTGRGNGRQMLAIVRALRDPQGNFMGIVHGMIELDYYRQQFEALNLGAQGIAALRRRDNHAQLVRWPDRPADINKPLASDHPVVKRLLTGATAVTLHYAVAGDPIVRIMGIQPLQNYPFYFAVGVGRDDVLAGWRQQAMVVGISTLLLLGLFGTLLLRLWRMRLREVSMLSTLARSEAQFRALAEMVPVGICHIDLGGKYTYVNERHLELTGRSRDELLGKDWSNSFHPDDRTSIHKSWKKEGKGGMAFVREYRFVRPDGQLTHVLGEVRTENDSDGKVRGYIIAQTDITRRKEIEAELLVAKQRAESSSLAKTRFLAAASHDLRQPIQAINLFRDALDRTDLSEEQKTISNFLSLSVHSLGELLYALLDIAKLDAGHFRPQLKVVSVDELFKAVDAEFSPLALEKGLRFKLFYPLKGLQLMTDPATLLSILRNLIDNAFKYTRSGGVLVGVRQRAGRAIVQVWDTGIGIEPHHGEQVFDECFQVNDSVHDRTRGLGLGLSIARRMARLLGGEVIFHSRPGRGTVFELSLPLAAGPALRDAGAPAPEPLAGGALCPPAYRLPGWRVVVIEDDPMVAKSIELALEKHGGEITTFASAELALAWPKLLDADFYLSDFTLPGLNGLQLLDAIAQRSTTPIKAALMTGETLPERLGQMNASGWTVLVKPVGLSALLAAMTPAQPPATR